ncbi:MAG: hypothetical protein BAJATHORv1_40103 [Candidatus Thorarchaeota archaeon]|nr:MAG: hypothetical protein BAJATHORv1_40103 [Candidatus Thorarchaeota archaeon]
MNNVEVDERRKVVSEDKESMTDKLKRAFSIKVSKPKNPFKGNPYKKGEEEE